MKVWVLEDELTCMAGLQEQQFGGYIAHVRLIEPDADDAHRWRTLNVHVDKPEGR